MPAARPHQQPQSATSTGMGFQLHRSALKNDGIPFSVYEVLLKIQQSQVLDLATQLAQEKVKGDYMCAELARRAEKAAAFRAHHQRAAVQTERTYGCKFTQYGFSKHILHGHAGDTTFANLLQQYARHTKQDFRHLELFYDGKMVNLGLAVRAWKGKWSMEVRDREGLRLFPK
ncbi:hypothetical protein LTR36_009675 [Oleoguttula mirabilis]|uniref:Uncharacterized protein n=1 Tax=Oleoguttula mirabilis TaxID=1507867 RepID=A0AAV9J6Z8_9PEZI|nr:hypothetical protein LTR36_009675 [Oleoguttula mirabilis]